MLRRFSTNLIYWKYCAFLVYRSYRKVSIYDIVDFSSVKIIAISKVFFLYSALFSEKVQ